MASWVTSMLYLISSLRFHGDLFHDSSLAFSPSRTDRSIRRGILLRADQTGVSLDTAASGDSKYKKQDDKVIYGRRAPSGGQRVEEGGRVEDHAKWTTNIVDEKVDMFAFGVLVLEVITSRRAV
ncbi:BnaC06g14600D [Brassica napus]|uniref:BnaC06g14600D protein n=1 Tax=Brassica napus TaxID=3708 RepID=A0A078FJV9_BRANA|nr:BnaC06g14600D [Brassica napus]